MENTACRQTGSILSPGPVRAVDLFETDHETSRLTPRNTRSAVPSTVLPGSLRPSYLQP